MSKERWYDLSYVVFRVIAAIFYPHRYSGAENVPEGAAIICAPHSNALDPLLVSLALGRKHYVHHLAKAEVKKVPLLGWYMKKCGSIFVRRGESDIESYKQCMRVLKAGEKLMIFPEGTRVHGDDVVKPKSGAVRLAAKLHVPILPVYITRDKKIFRRMEVIIGEPYYIEAAPHADYDALAQECMDRILALKG
jgi:1-acyl-sn-glycerol-3-phosphate acyltransferase